MTKWQKKLTARERKHLKEDAGITTLALLRGQMTFTAKQEKHGGTPCHECKGIAQKLGITADQQPEPTPPGRTER